MPLREPVEAYFSNLSHHFSFSLGRNISRLSVEKSKDLIESVEKIKLMTNRTLEDVANNLNTLTKEQFIINVLEAKERPGRYAHCF